MIRFIFFINLPRVYAGACSLPALTPDQINMYIKDSWNIFELIR